MRVDVDLSEYHEADSAKADFTSTELRRLRVVLRRLRFLEHQVRENGGLANESGSGGAAFAEMEVEALEWVLTDAGYLAPKGRKKVST